MKVPTEAEMQAMRDRLEIRGSSVWWKVRLNNVDMTQPAGTIKRSNNTEYLIIGVQAKGIYNRWSAHRIAWFLHHGQWPTTEIDHRDRDGLNNSPNNLRAATKSQNSQNKLAQSNSITGIKGVFKARNGFRAQLTVQGEVLCKQFPTLQEAIDHRKYLEKTYHPWSPSVI